LPFETQIIICQRRDIDRLLSRPESATATVEAQFVHFVSVSCRPAAQRRCRCP
jgi:hypothetical protein